MTDEEKLRNAGWSPGSLLLAMNDQDSPLARRDEANRNTTSDRLALKRPPNAYLGTPKSKNDREPKVLDQKVTPLIHNRCHTIDLTCSTVKKDAHPPIFHDDDNNDENDEMALLTKTFRRQSFQPKNLKDYNEQDENNKPISINLSRNGSDGNRNQKSTSIGKNTANNDERSSSIDMNRDRNNNKKQNFTKDLSHDDSRRTESISINNSDNTDHDSSANFYNRHCNIKSSGKCENTMHDTFDTNLMNNKKSDYYLLCSKISNNNISSHNINDKSSNTAFQPNIAENISANGDIDNSPQGNTSLNIPQNHENKNQPSKEIVNYETAKSLDVNSNTKNESGQLEKLLLAADLDCTLPNGIYVYIHIYIHIYVSIKLSIHI
jgi:hypothetical protein